MLESILTLSRVILLIDFWRHSGALKFLVTSLLGSLTARLGALLIRKVMGISHEMLAFENNEFRSLKAVWDLKWDLKSFLKLLNNYILWTEFWIALC